jgi:hypothetical protein
MVQNARLEELFLAKKAEFRKAGKPTGERIGFHGTSTENARGIVEQVRRTDFLDQKQQISNLIFNLNFLHLIYYKKYRAPSIVTLSI